MEINKEQIENKVSEIGENEVNQEKTLELQNDQVFKTFMDWCYKHKLYVHENLLAPAAFGPLGIPGIAAKEDIPANTVIAAIPNKLFISLKAIKAGELKEIFKSEKDSDIFSDEGDGEFNIIAAFLIYEKCKGGSSFYQPYFDTIQRSFTMYDWSISEVSETECPELIDEFEHYVNDMKETWSELKECLLKYPNFFKEELLTEEIFLWSYELIMTRIFGYSLPCTCLVPFGDLFNHGNHSATHYILNKRFEEDETLAHPDYKIKKHKIDLSIFDKEKTNQFVSSGNDYHFRSRRFRFVKDHHKILPKEMQEKIDWEKQNYLEDEPLREMLYEINARELIRNKEINIWDLNFFTTSATEDNDTDEEQTNTRKKEYDTLFNKELKIIETAYKRTKGADNSILTQSNTLNESEITHSTQPLGVSSTAHQSNNSPSHHSNSEQSGFESSEYESEEEEDDEEEVPVNNKKSNKNEEEEEEKKNNEDKGQIRSNNKKEFKDEKIFEEKKEEEINIINLKKAQKNYDEDSVSSLSDDSKWSWYETQKENTYFAVTTEQPVKKGEQVFLCYGRRTNKFLLQWYGFAFSNNLFDSFGFRMWIKPEPHGLEKNIEETIVFRKYITEQNWQKGYVMNNNVKILTKDLTKEFRLKKGHLCEEFIVYLRIYLSSHYNGLDISKILFTLPRSLGFEMFVFSFAKRILKFMRDQYKTTIQEDEEVLNNPNISYKKRFATVLKMEHKKLLDEQLQIIEIVFKILDRLDKKQFNLQSHKESLSTEQTNITSDITQQEIQLDQTENKENQDNKENQSHLNSSKLSKDDQYSETTKQEIILTEEDTNSLKIHYMYNFEQFASDRELVQERHKIKKYLKYLYLGKYKQYIV